VRHGHDGLVCADGEWTERLAQALGEIDAPWARELSRNGEETVRREHGRRGRIERLARHIDAAAAS